MLELHGSLWLVKELNYEGFLEEEGKVLVVLLLTIAAAIVLGGSTSIKVVGSGEKVLPVAFMVS